MTIATSVIRYLMSEELIVPYLLCKISMNWDSEDMRTKRTGSLRGFLRVTRSEHIN